MSEWFDRFSRVQAPSRRWKAPMIACGAVVHAALFTAMWAKGVWDIKKVEAAENEVTLTMAPNPPAVDAAPAGAPKPPTPTTARRVVKGTTQPTVVDPKVVPDTGVTGPSTGPVPDGIVTGEPDPLPPQEPLLPKVTIPPPPLPPVAVKPKLVEQSKLERTSGETGISPDGVTAQQIAHEGSGARGTVRLCISASGVVESSTVVRSTHFAAYDDKLERETRQWRYRPYTVNGVATPVCTMVTFIYQQR